MKLEHIFVESNRGGYPISIFTESEIKFLSDKELIEVKLEIFLPKFVGELITPENSYFSLPKNFEPTLDNVELFKKVLLRYKDLKKDGKTLLSNNTFTVSPTGKLESEKFYYNELKEYFMDYITYEFIYPKKKISKHSTSPLSGGKIDVLKTVRNQKRFGPGITYNVKDSSNNDNWNLDDIYWSTIKTLHDKYGDNGEVDDMAQFLESEGYKFKQIDISDTKKIIEDIKKCDIGIIHQPIKNTLLDYFESNKIGERYQLNIFYTNKFQYVWEELVRESLKNNKEFKDSLKDKFFRIQTLTKSFFSEEEANQFVIDNKCKNPIINKREGYNVWILRYDVDVSSIPDLFSVFENKRFIGDAKYYRDPENAEFEKEFKTYNTLTDNKYPMVVLVPTSRTGLIQVRKEDPWELIILQVSVKEAIRDAIYAKDTTARRVYTLIDKYTDRRGEDYLGGF